MKILLAVDGSECSDRAANFLTRFHLSPQDEIIILHVISEIPYEDDSYANIKRFIKRVAPQILESSANILGPVKAKIIKQEEEGYPDITIMKVAEDADVDLIVMGTKGIRGIKSLFIGSVTRSVAINSVKPVLVTRRSPWGVSETMKVLLAADGSDSALATAELLTSMPFYRDTEFLIISVSWSAFSDIPDQFTMEINEKIKEDVARVKAIEYEKARQIMEQSRAYLRKRFTRIEELIRVGDPSMEILNAAERFHADIIAVGCRGLKGIKGMMGSVSRRILGHSQCPVLIGKAR
jgi:nucleotide-binding universal stress UspA family protein